MTQKKLPKAPYQPQHALQRQALCGGMGSEHREGLLGVARGPRICVDVGVQTEGKRGKAATFPARS